MTAAAAAAIIEPSLGLAPSPAGGMGAFLFFLLALLGSGGVEEGGAEGILRVSSSSASSLLGDRFSRVEPLQAATVEAGTVARTALRPLRLQESEYCWVNIADSSHKTFLFSLAWAGIEPASGQDGARGVAGPPGGLGPACEDGRLVSSRP